MVFNRVEAEEYDNWYETEKGAFVDEVETALAFELFQPEPGERVLDAGCGTGNFSLKLARKGCQVVGIDISGSILKLAREKVSQTNLKVEFYQQNLLDLDFAGESFDSAFSMAAFEFIKDYERAFRQIKRVVKPGGRILIGTITRESSWGRLYRRQGEQEDSVFRHAHFKNPEDLNRLDPENLIASRECLFIPPDTPDEKFNWDEENRLAGEKKGGFFCSLWRKPL